MIVWSRSFELSDNTDGYSRLVARGDPFEVLVTDEEVWHCVT